MHLPSRFLAAAALVLGLSLPARAEPPRVVADIAPVQSLAARVMAGVGTPDLLIPPGSAPHSYTLRPSQARALQEADLVVWVGTELTPWMDKPVASLAPEAARLELLRQSATLTRPFRDLGANSPATQAGQEAEAGPDMAPAGDIDPHAWLDPQNGRTWLGLIAEALVAADPDNAAVYRANARAGQAELDRLSAELAALLAPMRGRPFVTFHDAFQYFEIRFGLDTAGTVLLSDATDPSPARLAALRATMAERQVRCAFSEPQFNDGLLRAAAEGSELDIAVLDPVGVGLTGGAGLYPDLLRAMARNIAGCAG